MSADRNLLFGMLALHAGLITREQLLEAFNAWMLDKEVALGEILSARGALDAEGRRMLDGLVERQIRRHGDARRSLAAMSAAPEARRDLERLADADVQASLASVGAAEHTPADRAAAAGVAGAACPGGASRYRKLEPHARGGLGEVFVALDEELQRRVALKEIQEQYADDAGSQRRFLREAEITGNLEHPGVVPVYGLLRQDGRPTYAMRFIKGETLHDALRRFHAAERRGRDPGERSLALRGLLTRFVAVCNAVGYAHSRGVIHRDLKPANVMLGAYGETIVVDWGLARVLVQTDPEQTTPYSLLRLEDKDTATQLGKALGTPAYMPPEQALGEHGRVGIRSDVFALGAMLYALLTGKAPFRDLEQAKLGDFTAPRQVNALTPRALEAVCIKALAVRPEERYASARALSEDVEHWLADEPVSAYSEPVADRVRRWGRRNRALVTSGVALLLASVAGLGLGLWAVEREKAATRRELARAEDNLDLAKKAVDAFYALGKEQPLLQKPQMRQVRRLILENVLPFYQDFQEQRPRDAGIQAGLAEQHYRVADILDVIGREPEARSAYERARGLYTQLVEAYPGRPEHRQHLARTHNNLAPVLKALGKREEALAELRQAQEIREMLSGAHPGIPEYQHDLAKTHTHMGLLLADYGRNDEAMTEYRRALDLESRLSKAYPEAPEYQNVSAWIQNCMGSLLDDLGRREQAFDYYRLAQETLSNLVKAHPEVPEYRQDLAATHNNRICLARPTQADPCSAAGVAQLRPVPRL
jgi:serine/threonine-protein kinase